MSCDKRDPGPIVVRGQWRSPELIERVELFVLRDGQRTYHALGVHSGNGPKDTVEYKRVVESRDLAPFLRPVDSPERARGLLELLRVLGANDVFRGVDLPWEADFYEEHGSKKLADTVRSGVVDGAVRNERGFVVQRLVWHTEGPQDLPGREDSRVSLVKELVTPEGRYELLESREIEQGVVASWFELPMGC